MQNIQKRVRTSYDWFWLYIYLWLDEKVTQVFEPIVHANWITFRNSNTNCYFAINSYIHVPLSFLSDKFKLVITHLNPSFN